MLVQIAQSNAPRLLAYSSSWLHWSPKRIQPPYIGSCKISLRDLVTEIKPACIYCFRFLELRPVPPRQQSVQGENSVPPLCESQLRSNIFGNLTGLVSPSTEFGSCIMTSTIVVGIQDIPSELLGSIFLCYVENWHSSGWEFGSHYFAIYTSWTAVLLQVCRLWTSIAYASPPLWAHVRLPRTAEQLRWQLNLAGETPLKICSRDGLQIRYGPLITNTDIETEQLLHVQCFERMESLELSVHLYAITPLFRRPCPLFAPRLTHLVLVPRNGFTSEYRFVSGRGVIEFLSNHCPQLLFLELSEWDELFGFTTLPANLNVLRLHDSRWRAEGEFTLDCISSLKRLQVLDIRGAYLSKPIYCGISNSSDRLELPCLDTLYFATAHIQSIQRVLSELDTAPLVSLHIEGKMLLLTHSLDQLCSTLGSMSQPVEGVVDTLLLKFGTSKIIADWSRSGTSGIRPIHVFLSLDLPGRRDSPRDNNAMRAIFVRLCKSLISKSLAYVEVKCISPLPNLFQKEDWQETFGSPALEKLNALMVEDSPSIWGLIAALSGPYEALDDENAAWLGPPLKPFFPALKYLTLRGADLKNHKESSSLNDLLDPQESYVNLKEMLVVRRNMGVHIEELTLDECEGLEGDEYDELRAIVNVLHVPATGEDVLKRVESLFGDD